MKLACKMLHAYDSCVSHLSSTAKCPDIHGFVQSVLLQAADHFMHMLESHNGPDHLVVFITSDQDFGEKIQELQRRNFKVAVIYHGPHASKRPASIIHAADESYDWLEFLAKELKASKLTLSPYDSSVMQPGTSVAATPPATLVKAEAKKANQDVKVLHNALWA